jgi:hypothetical protein
MSFLLGSGAPTFNITDLQPALYALGVLVLAGVVATIGPVLVIKGPFILVRIVLHAINRLFGRAKPAAT